MLEYLWDIGLRVTVYVDDFSLGRLDKYTAEVEDKLLNTLEGFGVFFLKAQLSPSTKIDYYRCIISNA